MFSLTLLLLSFSFFFSQHVKAVVKTEALRFTEAEKSEATKIGTLIRDYINDYDWIQDASDEVISLNISIVFESIVDVSGRKKYNTQFIINTVASEYFYDKDFTFSLPQEKTIKRSSSDYREIGNFLDFYIYMALAGELDTFGEYAGDIFYSKAREALDIGQKSTQSGWNYRKKVFEEYTSPLVRPIRKAKLIFFSALNYKNEKKYRLMRQEMSEMINEIEFSVAKAPNNLMIKRFFEVYHKRIMLIIDSALDQATIIKLTQLDPARKSFYLKYMRQ